LKDIRDGSFQSNHSFFNHTKTDKIANIGITATTDDLALLKKNSDTHQEVESSLVAFDDLQLVRKRPNHEPARFDKIERHSMAKRSDSMFKNVIGERFDYEEMMNPKKRRVSIPQK